MAREECVRAEYILVTGKTGRELWVVYGPVVLPLNLPVEEEILGTIPRVHATADRKRLNGPKGPLTTVLRVRLLRGCNTEEVIGEVRNLTRPKLPYTIASFNIEALACSCGRVTKTSHNTKFVPGFAPDDEKEFQSSFDEELGQLNLAELLKTGGLKDALVELLKGLGAHASEINITQPDPKDCTHAS